MIRLLLNGCNGKVGKSIISYIMFHEGFRIVAGITRSADRTNYDFPVFNCIDKYKEEVDVIVDFSRPEALPYLLNYSQSNGVRLVIGTTGFSEVNLKEIRKASRKIPIFMSPNMSLGIMLLMEFVKSTCLFFGEDFDIEIINTHHRQKVDSPSGTSMEIARQVNKAFNNTKKFVYGRYMFGEARKADEIGVHSISGGNLDATHSVIFAGDNESLEISHRVNSRQAYAEGVIRAVEFLIDKPPGLYGMEDLFREIRKNKNKVGYK